MRKRWFIAFAMVLAMAPGLVASPGCGSKTTFSGWGEPIDAMGEGMYISPLVVERDGEARTIDSLGTWSLERLGYSDLVFPCTDRFEALQIEYMLPEGAAQDPEEWYALIFKFRIEFDAGSGDGRVKVGVLTNDVDAGSTRTSFEIHRSDRGLEIEYRNPFGFVEQSSSRVLDITLIEILNQAGFSSKGVQPGLNTLTFILAQYEGAAVKRMRVLRDSAIERIYPEDYAGLFEHLPTLPPEEEARARQIVLSDPRVQELVQGKDHEISLVTPWGDTSLGAQVDISFDRAHEMEYDWPLPSELSWLQEMFSGTLWVRGMRILIDLDQGVVTMIMPFPSMPEIPIEDISWGPMESGVTHELLSNIWGSSPSDVFAVGSNGTILHYDGIAWSAMDTGTARPIEAIWGSSPSDIFAVGVSGTILHYDGATWTEMDSGTTEMLRGIWGSSASDVYAVGWNSTILHYDGSTWSSVDHTASGVFSGVWGASSSDVFVVATEQGDILHYDGTSWTTMDTGSTAILGGVWGTSGSNVFAVGDGGTVLHYDGSSWSQMENATRDNLRAIWGSSDSDVFTAGLSGTILHYDGTSWSLMHIVRADLYGIWGSSPSDVFAVGSGGTILHHPETLVPRIATGTPDQGKQGETLVVAVKGANFTGATAVDFGEAVIVDGFTVASPNRIMVNIIIDGSATIGSRDISVTTSLGTATLSEGFIVAARSGGLGDCGAATAADITLGKAVGGWSILGLCFGIGYCLVRKGSRRSRE